MLILLAHMSLSTCLLTYQTVGFVRSRGRRTLVRLLYATDVNSGVRDVKRQSERCDASSWPYLIKGPREYLSLSFHSNFQPVRHGFQLCISISRFFKRLTFRRAACSDHPTRSEVLYCMVRLGWRMWFRILVKGSASQLLS